MQTLHPVLKHGGLFWDRELVPPALFGARLERIQAAIRASGDDAWLIYGDAQRYGDLAHATHFVTRLRSAVAFVPRDGEPVMLAAVGSRDVPASKVLTWVEELRPYGSMPPVAAALVEERGLARGAIGLVGAQRSLPIAEWGLLREKLPEVRWTQRDAEYRALRALHEDAERGAVRRAAEVAERALAVAREALRPGRTLREVTALVDREARYGAAEDVRILTAAGERTGTALRPPDERVLAGGDALLLFLGVEVQRYWAEAAQTLVLGPVAPELRRLADDAHGAIDAMRAAARPGARGGDVAAAAQRVLGGGERWERACAYGLGHGIGLDADEPPAIAPGSTDEVGEGGVLALHVVLHQNGIGAAVGRTVAAGADGTRALTVHDPIVACTAP